MWPDYRFSQTKKKKLLLITEEGKIYEKDGRFIGRDEDDNSIPEIIARENAYLFVESLSHISISRHILSWASDNSSSILASNKGAVIAARFQKGTRSNWLVSIKDSWGLEAHPDSLYVLEDTFDHIGVGEKPTPGSLGKQSMRYIYSLYNLDNHTCLPLSCEQFIKDNGFGGIVVTNNVGSTVDVASQMDKMQAYVSKYDRHPDKTPVWFSSGIGIDHFATWFAHVKIVIPKELPLGVFPIRHKNNRVEYPTKKGVYYTHIWKEDVEVIRNAGCSVFVGEGWGWERITTDNVFWSEFIYNKRQTAPYKEVEKMVKKVAVAAIGSMGRGREVYTVVGENLRNPEKDVPVISKGVPLNIWIHEERDDRSSIMNHWNEYTVRATNREVREFALPFAEEGRLVMIDYDSVFTVGVKEGEKYVHKNSIESILCKPGSWLWSPHHNFKILRNRMWVSDEEPSRYGSLLEKVI